MFKKVATPVFGIVEDMNYFLCLPLRGRREICSLHGRRQKPSGSVPTFMANAAGSQGPRDLRRSKLDQCPS